ncbi:MAG: hypothetical protein JRF28_06725 [Deltaproteobacteria bacterium]|nr:hypothetical protein [Deltaproteobacteria bacterium]
MKTIIVPVLSTLLGVFQSRALLHLEILALRQQLAMVKHTSPKRLRTRFLVGTDLRTRFLVGTEDWDTTRIQKKAVLSVSFLLKSVPHPPQN